MTTLRHPHISPPPLIEVEDERVPAHLAAGWLLDEEPDPETDPVQTGDADLNPSEEPS